MRETVFNDVVRLMIATSASELEAVLAFLPHGVRYGIVRDLEEFGEAHRFECLRNCAYFVTRHEQGVQIWRWNYVASQAEFNRLRALVSLSDEPLDGDVAGRIFERATRRSVANPRVLGMAYVAVDFSQRPALSQAAAG